MVGFVDTRLFSKSDLKLAWPIMACAPTTIKRNDTTSKPIAKYFLMLMRGARSHRAAIVPPRITINPIIAVMLTPDAPTVSLISFIE
jgi:hypothetical protein